MLNDPGVFVSSLSFRVARKEDESSIDYLIIVGDTWTSLYVSPTQLLSVLVWGQGPFSETPLQGYRPDLGHEIMILFWWQYFSLCLWLWGGHRSNTGCPTQIERAKQCLLQDVLIPDFVTKILLQNKYIHTLFRHSETKWESLLTRPQTYVLCPLCS